MHSEDFLVNYGRNGQAIEAVGKRLPQFDIVTPLALVVEPVDAVDRGTLMISPKDEKVLGILDFVRK